MATTESTTGRIVTLAVDQAGDGSLRVTGTYSAQRVYDIQDLGKQVREQLSLDLGSLYSGLTTAERSAVEKALSGFLAALDRVAQSR